jgi:hypothetical protein
MITVEATAFMLARKLASRLKGEEGEAAIKRSYLTPTALEAQGKVGGPVCSGDDDDARALGCSLALEDTWPACVMIEGGFDLFAHAVPQSQKSCATPPRRRC